MSFSGNFGPHDTAIRRWLQVITMAIQGDPGATATLNDVTGRPDAPNILRLVDTQPEQLGRVLASIVERPDDWAPGAVPVPGDPGYDEFQARVIGLLQLIAERIRMDAGR